jgi:hypothetical protein
MEKNGIIWGILLSVIIMLVLSLSIPILVRVQHPDAGQNPVQTLEGQPARLPAPSPSQEESKHLKTAISFINIGLLLPLSNIYSGIYRRMRSSFTLGLMAVIFALEMYAVTSNPLIVSLLGGRIGDIGFFQIVPDLCTTAALLVLIRISLE